MNDELESFSVTDWKYKAEGNKHIVICDGKGKVLRLVKLSGPLPEQESHSLQSRDGYPAKSPSLFITEHGSTENKDELDFMEHVVLPLMNNCDACHIPKYVQLSKLFYEEMRIRIDKDRPEHRKHKSLDCNAPGLLMHDHCFIPFSKQYQSLFANGLSSRSDLVTVEIKPKRGYMATDAAMTEAKFSKHKVCQYCRTQIYRVVHGQRFKKCSFYCPLDLFSGVEECMNLALKELFRTPQNNFRIFRNGKLEFSQDIIDASRETCNITPDHLLQPLLSSNFFDDYSCVNDIINLLIDLVCQSLLLPIVEKHDHETVISEHCLGLYLKEHLCKQTPQNAIQRTTNCAGKLPANCILGLIHSLQLLDHHSISDIKHHYDTVTSSGQLNLDLNEHLAFDAPYSSDEWCTFINSILKNGNSASDRDEKHKSADLLRKFLVAKSFSDCSVMISFQRIIDPSVKSLQHLKKTLSSRSPTAHLNILQDKKGQNYIVSVAVVDTDPKFSQKIPDYYNQHTKIMEWWEKIL
ncbi:inositol-pentakisphosphate 2-kinase-like [Clavelina lepadiformis]|uniref:inositol-pentakisphosphate 2-kinase-like n=1 Tax=Clavelina lepadiformis TaxID=159417 RepID=UPI0040429EDA